MEQDEVKNRPLWPDDSEDGLVAKILAQRGADYGDSWLTPTLALAAITRGDLTRLEPLVKTGHFANWFIILGKLCRAMNSPLLLDHWVDIAGYAELSAKSIRQGQEDIGGMSPGP